MHKYGEYPLEKRKYYESMLKAIGSLSRLFSESDAPHLDSKIAENLYCKSFNAQNKSKANLAIDAVFEKTGIGIKTFQGNGSQKISEHNKDLSLISPLRGLNKAIKISELRNRRLQSAKDIYGVDDLKYHCIRREKGKIILCESPMDSIDIANLKIINENAKSIEFTDGKNKYSFTVSKSVLLKKFPKEGIVRDLDVKILSDPYEILEKALENYKALLATTNHPYVILPLYSVKKGKKIIPDKSGLNQWNAGGRARHKDEVYIPIPSWVIHDVFPNFFPPRGSEFTLKLPDGNEISAKVCQQNDKALMSKPNKALGEWILRKVLHVKENHKVTYKLLQEIGVDSVIIQKLGDKEYRIDFREEGEFEKFTDEKLKAE